jgi:hypothetical protein
MYSLSHQLPQFEQSAGAMHPSLVSLWMALTLTTFVFYFSERFVTRRSVGQSTGAGGTCTASRSPTG